MSKIMAVRAEIFDNQPTDTLITDPHRIGLLMQDIELNAEYRERSELETDPAWRQPIPYVILRDEFSPRYVMMRRGVQQGESRLHGKVYLGAGGHVEDGHCIFYTALKEVTEETGLPIGEINLEGILICSGSDVDDVHLCCFYRALTSYDEFTSPERDQHDAKWATPGEIADEIPNMERWSQIIARDYLNLTPTEQQSK